MQVNRYLPTLGLILALLLVGLCTGSGMTVQVGATGTSLSGDMTAIWTISDGSMDGVPPLACGQEIVSGIATERFLTTGQSSYGGVFALNNSDIIHMDVAKSITATGTSIYSNALALSGVGSGAPEGGCAGDEFAPPTTENETIPSVDPYCSLVSVQTSLMGSQLQYGSAGQINAWSSDVPDDFMMDFAGSVNGVGTVTIGSYAMTANGGGPGVLGYENQYTSRIQAIGKPATIGGRIQWSSFKNTFSIPPGDESEIQET